MSSRASSVSAAPARPGKARIALWDNARFVLIVLVVIGHVISTVRTDSVLAFDLYVYIYLFHMPAMILLSGLFSRAETSPKAIRSTIQLFATWGLWEGIWAVIHLLADGKAPGERFLVSPAWTLWFLVTLATMRIVLPYIAMLRRPLLFSIVVALVSGLSPAVGTEFSASRTLIFLPFFVAGWLIKERAWLDGNWFAWPSVFLRTAAWIVLGGVALVILLVPGLREMWRIDRWLTWRDDYARLFERAPLGEWHPTQWGDIALGGAAVTAGLLGLAAVMIFAILVVVPRAHGIATVWGARTLYVYLLHAPIVWGLRTTGVIDRIGDLGILGLILLVLIGVGIGLLLSMTWVTRVFRPVIEPDFGRLLQRSPA